MQTAKNKTKYLDVNSKITLSTFNFMKNYLTKKFELPQCYTTENFSNIHDFNQQCCNNHCNNCTKLYHTDKNSVYFICILSLLLHKISLKKYWVCSKLDLSVYGRGKHWKQKNYSSKQKEQNWMMLKPETCRCLYASKLTRLTMFLSCEWVTALNSGKQEYAACIFLATESTARKPQLIPHKSTKICLTLCVSSKNRIHEWPFLKAVIRFR